MDLICIQSFFLFCGLVLVTGSVFDNEIPTGNRTPGHFQTKEQNFEIDNHVESQQRFFYDKTTQRPFTDKPVEPSPCQLVLSPFGCCWNNKHIATGPNGEGCPVCRDRKHHQCKNWAQQCKDKIVEKICPHTCGICKKKVISHDDKRKCEDQPFWTTQCALYKEMDLCYMPSIKIDCPKTCGICI